MKELLMKAALLTALFFAYQTGVPLTQTENVELPTPAPSIAQEEQQTIADRVYVLRMENGALGSCVGVKGTLAATAAHMGAGKAVVVVDGKNLPATVSSVDGYDFAWVTVPDADFAEVEISRDLEYFQDYQLYGKATKVVQNGIIVCLNGLNTSISIETAIRPEFPGIFPGDSGGGVFDMQGRLIGVISLYAQGEHRNAYFAPVPALPKEKPQAPVPPSAETWPRAEKPWLDIYIGPNCIYCEKLKRDWAAGEFYGFRARWHNDNTRAEIPQIEYKDKDGNTQVIIGYSGKDVIQKLKAEAR